MSKLECGEMVKRGLEYGVILGISGERAWVKWLTRRDSHPVTPLSELERPSQTEKVIVRRQMAHLAERTVKHEGA